MLSLAADGYNRPVGYSYDAPGNMLADGVFSYTYDAENRMTMAAGVSYTYDGDGRRVKKSNGKLYWYGAGSDPLAESDGSGNITAEFIFFAGKRIARRDTSGNVFYYFADHLGTARVVTNDQGQVLDDSDFYPFGGERPVVGPSSGNAYKFTGKERDTESALDYFGARYYSSSFGRFLTSDPIVHPNQSADGVLRFITEPQNWNRYAYVRNNPLKFIDRNGFEAGLAYVPTPQGGMTVLSPFDPRFPRSDHPVRDTLLVAGLFAAGLFGQPALAAAADKLAWTAGGGSLVAQLRDKAMGKIQDLMEAVEEGGLSASRRTLDFLSKGFNALRDHLTNQDITAAIREGLPNLLRAPGQHRDEVSNTLNSLNNLAEQLAKQLESSKLTEQQRQQLGNALEAVRELAVQISNRLLD